MNQNSGGVAPQYDRLAYVALNVTDLAASRHFYEHEVGLQFSGKGPLGELYLRCGYAHHCMVLYTAAKPGLKRIAFEMADSVALRDLRDRVQGRGLATHEVQQEHYVAKAADGAFQIVEPVTGVTLEFFSGMEAFGGQPFVPTVAKIQRLGHIGIRSPDIKSTAEFFMSVLGFALSDFVDSKAYFLRCPPNPFHHSMALGHGAEAGLHHINFMVSEIDDVGRGIARFTKESIPIVHGPGRHPPSGSVFLYFLDPDGMTVEYSYGMEEFPPGMDARKPRMLAPVPESIDYWGSMLDKRKGIAGEIEPADFHADAEDVPASASVSQNGG
ncbi:glyoxalase/bleomycin resistance protein/dioxygenase [Caballeronia udeis]|uniref:Glyoxalase/bleomycin resistance protein/dioxygenase n=1 Tax=Caballeronia udeis TaxID=1232866 RepID=A0A158JIG0_9BURK|nr:VOC family protein [Caballeronia udeis]SAL68667.1 glyoxalase/bleomycin resistance protein/dioxygenase [Caballeronia udeis]